MIKFCRSCGGELAAATDKTCPKCSANAVKASAFCRYCGKPTNAQDTVCPTCGASLKPVPNSVRLLNPDHVKLMRAGKIINLTIVVIAVAAYTVFALPKSIRKPAAQAASDAVMASTGYTALPLDHLAISPPRIPMTMVVMFDPQPSFITVNTTRQITVYAIYKASDTENATKAIRAVDVTSNCTYQSSNESVAVCNATGLVRSTGPGTANITALYTAPPGSANMSNAAAGKIPVTISTNVGVFVK